MKKQQVKNSGEVKAIVKKHVTGKNSPITELTNHRTERKHGQYHVTQYYDGINVTQANKNHISQLIRYSRAYHNYDNLSPRHSMLTERLFNRGVVVVKLLVRQPD